jgi:L-threonylcarbamoyladenylate synthase
MVVFYFKCSKNDDLRKCASLLDKGSIIIFPTDTVYGIGCNPLNKVSVLKLFQIKNRPLDKYLPILSSSVSNLSNLVEFTKDAEKLIKYFWPGPLTLVLKIKENSSLDSNRYAFDKTVAIRIPNNKCTISLIEMTQNKLLIGTSANLSKQNPLIHLGDLNKCNLQGYDAIVDGDEMNSSFASPLISSSLSYNSSFSSSSIPKNSTNSIPVSTIIDVSGGNSLKIIREGVISKEEIFAILKKEK